MTAPSVDSQSLKPTSREALDAALAELDARKQAWVELGVQDRIDLLRRCMDTLLEGAEDGIVKAL